jgi:F-type H+-transporting ATPase subunit delta
MTACHIEFIRISGIMSAQASISGVAMRYARALFELAHEQKAVDAVASDMAALEKAISESHELARFVSSPLFGAQQQRAVFEALLGKMKAHALSRRLVEVLIANGRLGLLAQVARGFQALLARERGEVSVRAITAEPLGAAQRKKLQDALARALGRKVDVDNEVNPEIIGGLVLHVGSRMIDASVRSRLFSLQGMLKGV